METTGLDRDQTPSAIPGALPPDLALKIEYRDISTLRSEGRKPRTHPPQQIEAIAKSYRQFGFISAVLVDERGAIITGHARIAAARSIGITKVPVIVVSHLCEAEKRAYVIADNRLAELAGWDQHLLALEFQDLSALNLDFDLDVTGFSKLEIEALQFALEDEEDDPPTPSEVSAQIATSRPGDLFELGPHRLLCGDATDRASYAKLMGNEVAKVSFGDPPFNVPVSGHVSSNPKHREFAMASGEMTDAEFQAFLLMSLIAMLDWIVPGGVFYVCMDWRGSHLLEAAAREAKLEKLNLIVWDKMTGGMGSFYRSQHELIHVFRKPGAGHQNNVELGKHGRNRTNVWAYKGFNSFRSEGRGDLANHPTPKPVGMIKDALLDCTSKNDLVLDPFSGGGATLIAAQRSGRRARVMDIDPVYVDLAIRRWEAETGLKAIHAQSGLTFDEVERERASAPAPQEIAVQSPSETEAVQ